ncbi:MAG: glycosyltransferase [Acidobacteriia bacterium]|nr:glycosyltransferase [Terriglobia bacterium]
MTFDAADEALFHAYGFLDADEEAAAYLETHYQRLRATLSFLGTREPARILELGAYPPFTLMLARRFPQAEIAAAYHADPLSTKYYGRFTRNGRLALPSREPGFPERSFGVHCFNAERDVWPFDGGSFDLVLAMELLEHLLLDPCFLFREAHRVLAMEGSLIVTTPNLASLEGVSSMLGNRSPYRFGPYSPQGEYGRHNREYVPRELPLVGEACGFATQRIATGDVYPVQADPGQARKLLVDLQDDLSLRSQTIFYEGRKTGAPFGSYPAALYDYDVPEHSAILRVRHHERQNGGGIQMSVEVVNTGRYQWRPDVEDATNLGVQVLDRRRRPVSPDYLRVFLPRPLSPGEHAVLDFTVPDPGVADGFCLRLDMVHERVVWFSAAPRGELAVDLPSNMDRSPVLEFDAPAAREAGHRGLRIVIATTQVPFVRGGAELLAEGLRDALLAEGHQAEITAIPFRWYPPERLLDMMLACRLLDVSETCGVRTDVLIGLKFPAYFIRHPAKSLWLLHQHRTAYDLWGHELGDIHQFPNGPQVRDAIQQADRQLIPEARVISAISQNVARRLERYCGIRAQAVYHPPFNAERFHCAAAGEYLFFPSRLTQIKRQELVLEALALTRQRVVVHFAGPADTPSYTGKLHTLAGNLGVAGRVRWLGTISEDEKIERYARAVGVVFPPLDEDYGYVSLEAMLSSKPLVTCTDSGGPLEFVDPGATGLVAEPSPAALAEALDRLWGDRAQARAMGQAARDRYAGMHISWKSVVEHLLPG